MAGSTVCPAPNCRRKVRMDYAYYPYCFDHKDQSSAFMSTAKARQDLVGMGLRKPPSTQVDPLVGSVDMMCLYSRMNPSTAVSVLKATERLQADGQDGTIPSVSGQRVSGSGQERFIQCLEDSGIERDRIQVMEVSGMNRMTQSGKVQSAPGLSHRVVVLDQGTEQETVVDPFISSFAPVHDLDRPVDDSLPSGSTPFGDLPWVGNRDEYMDNNVLWWDHSQ